MDARADIVVLGAGLTGSGVALELARRGLAVTLVERDALALHRASLRNEGKIHLGYIYANDRSFATAAMQLEGALSFRRIVSRWAGNDAWLVRSTPFHYLVASDSVVPVDALAGHYAACERRFRERLADRADLDYLGRRAVPPVRPLTEAEISAHFEPARFAAGFATPELAIDTDVLARALRRAIAEAPGVTFRTSHLVRSARERDGGYRIEGEGPEGPWQLDARQVVNATWEQRLALDQEVGLPPPDHLLHRLKYRVIARLPQALHGAPSVSMVLGRYGDVVVREDGAAYLSWYPAGLRGWSHEVAPPADWDAPCAGRPDPALAAEIAREILNGIGAWYRGMGQSVPERVDAGAIVALGTRDVDDAASALHDRSRIGVFSRGGWHSVEPGKLTTAPMFAVEAADRVEAGLHDAAMAPRRSGAVHPRVVALVPVWRAAAFLDATLDALAAQTWPNLEILISDDASPDESAAIAERRVAADPRFRLIRQPRNLGWVGNVNALLAAARGDYLLFAFQDDLPEPSYIERCVRALEAKPTAVIAFSDIALVHQDGSREEKRYERLDGVAARVARARSIARLEGSWYIPNRGVFRVAARSAIGGLRRHSAGEFSADWPWLMHMSLLGEFVRVPAPLVTKIYLPTSLSRSWSFGVRSWSAVSADAMAMVARSSLSPAEKLALIGSITWPVRDRAGRSAKRWGGRWLRRLGLRPNAPIPEPPAR